MSPGTPKARASTVEPALALVELSSIAAGVQAADAEGKPYGFQPIRRSRRLDGREIVC